MAGMEMPKVDRAPGSLDEMTAGAPRSAREALQSGAITLEALRAAHRLRDGRSALDVIAALASFAALPVVVALYPRWWVYGLGVLLAIRNFNCAAQLVHESDHGTLFSEPRLNRFFGNVCAYLLGYTRSGHRQAHMDHHLYLNTDRDPDLIFSQPSAPGREIARGLVQDLFFVSAMKRFLQYFQSDRKTYSVSPWRTLTPAYFGRLAAAFLPVAVTQLALLALYTVTAGPLAYFLLHILPIMTLYPVQIRIRSIAEHGFEAGYRPDGAREVWVTRTSRLNPLEKWIVAPFGQYLHYEHHVFPSIPNYNLPGVHRLLLAAGIPVPVNRSYLGFVVRKIRAEWNAPTRARSAA